VPPVIKRVFPANMLESIIVGPLSPGVKSLRRAVSRRYCSAHISDLKMPLSMFKGVQGAVKTPQTSKT
jgi:hypothetical protein